MKKLFLSIITLVVAGFVFTSASLTPDPNDESLKDFVEFERTTHDFGNVNAGSQAKFEFTFTNKSDKTLEITNVKPSCGCTAPSYSREPVPPGGQGSITAVYTAPSSAQPFSKSITVSTSHGTFRLNIKGNVVETTKEPASPIRIN
jgi:hypothetical protein